MSFCKFKDYGFKLFYEVKIAYKIKREFKSVETREGNLIIKYLVPERLLKNRIFFSIEYACNLDSIDLRV